MKKRILSLFLAAAMLLAVFAFSSCEIGKTAYTEGLYFELNEDGESYSVQNVGEATATKIIIPPTYEGKPVTKIGNSAFLNCTDIRKANSEDWIHKMYAYILIFHRLPHSIPQVLIHRFLSQESKLIFHKKIISVSTSCICHSKDSV